MNSPDPGKENSINPNISPPVAPLATAPLPHSHPTPGSAQGRSGGERPSYASAARTSVTRQLFRASARQQAKETAVEIWHRTVNTGAVLFDFDNTELDTNAKVLEALGTAYGKDSIKGVKPIFYKRHCYEVLFTQATSSSLRHLATNVGLKVGNSFVKAQDTFSMSAKLTKVKLRDLPLYC